MKKFILVAVAGLFFAANSNAQAQREMPKHQHMQSDSAHHFQRGKMMQDLNLTAEQKTQMKTLHHDMMQQRNAIQHDASLSADQKKEKMKELHQTQTQKMNAILTPDQQEKMKAFRHQDSQKPQMHKGSQQMMQQLDLTSDQQTQMKALHETMQQQRNAIKNDASLSADQKKDKMKELRKTQMQKVNSILTPEQQAKMKAFREQRKQDHKMQKSQNKMNQSEQS
jgi:Spy/CpxP family protein refolding chaperone